MNIRPVGTKLFHADGQTDRHDEANSRFSQFFKRAQKPLRWSINPLPHLWNLRFFIFMYKITTKYTTSSRFIVSQRSYMFRLAVFIRYQHLCSWSLPPKTGHRGTGGLAISWSVAWGTSTLLPWATFCCGRAQRPPCRPYARYENATRNVRTSRDVSNNTTTARSI
jgi:hypothetical protein